MEVGNRVGKKWKGQFLKNEELRDMAAGREKRNTLESLSVKANESGVREKIGFFTLYLKKTARPMRKKLGVSLSMA